MDRSVASRAATLFAVLAILALFVGPIGIWPWDHDEVHSLVELGRVPLDVYPGPTQQLDRIHRMVPFWHFLQNTSLSILPANEWGTRLLPSISGAVAVLLSFFAGRRKEGPWFGWSLLILMGGSQMLVWLSQQNRFYPLALLMTVLAFIFMWIPDRRLRYDVLTGIAAGAAVLSHNLTLVVFALGGAAAVGVAAVGWMPLVAARRALVAAIVPSAIYLVYLRPLIAGWISGNTAGTSPLVSFIAQIGTVPMALAAFGCIASLRQRDDRFFRWWMGLVALSLAFVVTSGLTVGNWNPRYALFFAVPVWVMAAGGTAAIAEALAPRRLGAWWLAAVLLLLLPKLASHYIDGSRHDFRTAARIVADRVPEAEVVSNWPATLQYYLQPATGQQPKFWAPGQPLPSERVIVVLATNAWEPVLQIAGRPVTVLGEIRRRRFDEQSHVIRVYAVGAR